MNGGNRRFWRSLDEAAGSEAFEEALHREFPQGASEWSDDPVGRRRFLQLMGASLALAGVTGCTRQPKETIWPYVKAPEEMIPGRPLFFATALCLGGYAQGVLVESHMGRPTKVEGNPDHPASLGATDALAQAMVLSLYDPDRSKTVVHMGEIRTWIDFEAFLRGVAASQEPVQGEGLRILTETVTSPTLQWQIRKVLGKYPRARWHQYEPAARDAVYAGAAQAFGEPVETRYRFDRAQVILSLDADFLAGMPGSVRSARDFVARRRPETDRPEMSRLYVVESTPTLTGAAADHRFPLRASEFEGAARALASALGVQGAGSGTAPSWVAPVAADLKRAGRAAVIVASDTQPASVHALVHAMNHALGNEGTTVLYTDPVAAEPADQAASLRELLDDADRDRVSCLLILGGNPVYHAPADLECARRLEKVALRVHLGLYHDETAAACQWHVPEAHPFESWSDARAWDGSVTIVQPLIEPLYDGRSAHEVLAIFHGPPAASSHDLVRAHWSSTLQAGTSFDTWWRRVLRDGVVPGSAFPEKSVVPRPLAAAPAPVPSGSDLEIVFRTDPTIHDGRFSNLGWLQELPKPLTKLTWENAAHVGPRTAARLDVADGDVVELRYRDRTVEAPVLVLPGQTEGSVTVHLGYGRTRSGRVGNGAGFNAYALRTSDAPWFGAGLTLRKTGARAVLARTQEHQSMEGRHLVRFAPLEEFRKEPEFAKHQGERPPKDLTLYPPVKYEGHAWGMAIDLAACIGCGACTIACQAENNIPVVGKEQVHRGREMHWIRVDRYYEGGADEPTTHFQPVPCMQCENAPCELVCPVAATSHSSEGLNDMVYNRCVGTRYCSNNCPYKVRRFNFLLYSDFTTESLKMLRNPDVSVRSRGVMEKCTYCVQRINYARNQAQVEDRPIRDGEIVPACQQACPADAIVFGDLNDPVSRVVRWKASPREYGILEELNTRPRTTYLAALRNPNPEIGEP